MTHQTTHEHPAVAQFRAQLEAENRAMIARLWEQMKAERAQRKEHKTA